MTVITCGSRDICSKVLNFLQEELGIEEDRLCSCEKEENFPCRGLVSNLKVIFEAVGPESAQEVLDLVEDILPSEAGSEDEEPNLSIMDNPPFRCPELDIDIYKPCSVTSCAFHAEHPWARNCILYYMLRQERAHLTNNDLAFLLGSSPSALRSSVVQAMQKMRQGALKEEILKEPSLSMVTRLSPPNVCVVCESWAEKYYSEKDGLYYCSRACFQEKPPAVVRIESEFSLPIKRVLRLCTERFSAVSLMANAVGVTQSVFKDLCKKYEIELRE